MKVSECCQAENRMINDDVDWADISLCPECQEHCVFVDEDEGLDKITQLSQEMGMYD